VTVASLVYADADGIERSLTIGAEPVLVGRATECAIRSSDPRVSRNHARFYLDHTGTLHVEDLGSSNGVYVGPHKVQHCAVPVNELVFVGSLVFRMVAPAPPPPPMQSVEWMQPATQPAAPQWQPAPAQEPTVTWQPPQPAPVFTPPPAPAPPPVSTPQVDVTALVEGERQARLAAEEERDAYGARMAELHGELRALKQALETARAELAKPRAPTTDAEAELFAVRDQFAALEEQAKATATRLASVEEELEVARADMLSAEERFLEESRAHEQQLAARIEELEMTRADLLKAEERIVELERKLGR
jgi:hypothetical protein